jgi:hypothetical protein
MARTLQPHELESRDPLLNLLHRKLRVGNFKALAWLAGVTAVVYVGGTVLNGGKFSHDYPTHALDYTNTARKFVQMLLVTGVYLYLPGVIAGFFNSLLNKDRVLVEPGADGLTLDRFLGKLTANIDRWQWPAGGAAAVIVLWLLRFWGRSSTERHLWLEVLNVTLYSVEVYGGFVALVKLLIVMGFSNRLFRLFPVRVSPLHPDGVGGLRTIERMLINSLLILAPLLIVFIIGRFLSAVRHGWLDPARPEFVAFVILYASLLPLLFYGWIWAPHRAMVKARDALLKPLSAEFAKALDAPEAGARGEAEAVKNGTDYLEELQRRYKVIESTYPTWPVRKRRVTGLFSLAASPPLTYLLSLLDTDLAAYLKQLFSKSLP